MKAIEKLIETILPEFFEFLEEQEKLKNMSTYEQKGLDKSLFPSIHCHDNEPKGEKSCKLR